MAQQLFLLLIALQLTLFSRFPGFCKAAQVPAFFVIGDSLVDPGNNNYIVTIAKSNFPPYGMQFDTRMPTGRFTNGRTSADWLAALLGLPLPPAFLDPSLTAVNYLQGVNFASAGCGIIDATGNIFVGRIPLSEQVTQLAKVKKQIAGVIGPGAAENLIASSIVATIVGSNDYINNYLFKATKEAKLPPKQFQDLLISTYAEQVKRLYDIGVRKLIAFNIPPIGCIPRSLAFYGSKNGECIQFVNDFAINFNKEFKPLIQKLRKTLSGLEIVHTDSYKEVTTIYDNPSNFGFTFNSIACCGKGRYNGLIQCLPHFPSCRDYDQRIFFDSFHTTARANNIVANFTYFGGQEFNDPISVQQLASL
ncbi:GDSL esterase/lipase At1g71250 [Selaginella moellendorffii]|uniref:GDSL esterase/lipase At1g71250 n=1 Tax=Selaginella moellendorffii TaxID=88036 RepID=UPI000D1CEDB2|nr:GDSL esterase/lipase At1g71250 [Selaginella moellendorffii]|eukprot:XP_024520962.1 GDSL esterase/lipase At1g71250 [Selaginella moellendorffii]